jgi:DNA-binding NtrC family response regulator/CHASE2 domain-containing sensor protein
MPRKYLIVTALCILLVVLFQIFSSPVKKLDESLQNTLYRIRGALPADTNVVIMYFDNDDITSLGGGTLQRMYYARLIDVLAKCNVAAIGIEPFFGEKNIEYPEQDNLLAATAVASGRVVLSSYFRLVTEESKPASSNSVTDLEGYGPVDSSPLHGTQLQLPFSDLIHAAAGIGFTNDTQGSVAHLPLLISAGDRLIPVLSLEVLRVASQAGRTDVNIGSGKITLPAKGRMLRIPINANGTTSLNFPGPLSSFRRYRCIEVIRSFQFRQLGVAPSVDLASLENKIVLVSIIGEGRGKFFETPFDLQFPSIAIHATFIDNALNGRFQSDLSPLAGSLLLPVALALLSILSVHRFGYARGGAIVAALALSYLFVAYLLMAMTNLILPIVVPLVLLIVAWFTPLLYDYFLVEKDVKRLESEKEGVEGRLRESELKLQLLEKELLDQQTPQGTARGMELIEEIKRYKEEIKTLSSQVSDMVRFDAAPSRTDKAMFEGIVYDSGGRMQEVVDLVGKIAASEANILILGESGTGKELIAKAIHNLSNRKGKVFVAVNCGALTETLLESELFGHEKGSFTGAVKDKVGRFEYANGGTIFLDEVAETSEAFQVKLLRVVQSGEFERVGSTIARKTDARIVAATNKSLREMVSEKRFREDLYYRLNVFSVELPPLRERKGDIPLLAEHFAKQEEGSLSLSSTVVDAFLQYRWAGNVRELQSAITRAGIMARSDGRTLIQLRDIPEEIAAAAKGEVDIEDQILEILRSKKFSRSSISETAEELGGLNRGTVAEYFRGICFNHFFESSWNHEKAVELISRSDDPEIRDRVQKKLREYLANVIEGLPPGQDFGLARKSLRPKYKNLPQRYHTILDEVIRAYLLGRWK